MNQIMMLAIFFLGVLGKEIIEDQTSPINYAWAGDIAILFQYWKKSQNVKLILVKYNYLSVFTRTSIFTSYCFQISIKHSFLNVLKVHGLKIYKES
mgnify:CR=1 FL=1